MTIREIEAQSGMTRASIRYYEREGLLSPHREVNGYRDYSEADLATLLRIKLLRRLNVSLEEIKALQAGTIELAAILAQKADAFAQAEQDASFAQLVCSSMQRDGAVYPSLDARKYLDAIPEPAFETGFFTPGSSRSADLGQVARPWRRFLARMLDIFLYESLWLLFLALAFRTNIAIAAQNNLAWLFHTAVAHVIMLIVEPLLLNRFGTTLGKSIFGLHVEDENGGRPSYYAGFVRTWDVLRLGLGYNIPFYEIYTLWKSFKRCENWEPQPWDDGLVLTIRDTKWYRGAAYAVAFALVCMLVFTASIVGRVPPNRGDLTVAEFAENYNALADYFGVFYHRLDADGQWTVRADENTIFIGTDAVPRPPIEYTLENGHIKSVRWQATASGSVDPVYPLDMEMGLAALSFVGARREVGLYSRLRFDLFGLVANHRLKAFSVTEAGVTISHAVAHSGFSVAGYDKVLIPNKGETNHFEDLFSMERIA